MTDDFTFEPVFPMLRMPADPAVIDWMMGNAGHLLCDQAQPFDTFDGIMGGLIEILPFDSEETLRAWLDW